MPHTYMYEIVPKIETCDIIEFVDASGLSTGFAEYIGYEWYINHRRDIMTKDTEGAEEQARAQYESIKDMVSRLDARDEGARDQAIQEIIEDPLSVEVREGWHQSGEQGEVEEYMILLCTGGPACRIVGTLGKYNEPETASIQYQDWGTPWTEYRLTSKQEEIVLTYARQFYYGE